jgi:hypothetical protein
MENNEMNMAGAFEDWNEITTEEKRANEEVQRELKVEKDTEADMASPVGIIMKGIVQKISDGLSATVKHDIKLSKCTDASGHSYEIKADVESGSISVVIRKQFRTSNSRSYPRTDYNSLTGIAVEGYYRDGRGYGQDHETRSNYKVKLDGTWNYKGFAKKLTEKIDGYKAAAEREQKAAKAETEKYARKLVLHGEITRMLDCKTNIIGESETVTDYSRRYGSGYNSRYATKTDETAFRFSTKINDNSVTFKFEDDAETVKMINIGGKLSKDQLKAILEIINK